MTYSLAFLPSHVPGSDIQAASGRGRWPASTASFGARVSIPSPRPESFRRLNGTSEARSRGSPTGTEVPQARRRRGRAEGAVRSPVRAETDSEAKKYWPGTKSQASDGSGGRI